MLDRNYCVSLHAAGNLKRVSIQYSASVLFNQLKIIGLIENSLH